jgi:predicted nucleic acid-binding protein
MVFHMKTTLVIDDTVMAQLREEAVRRSDTISHLVESALRLLLEPSPQPQPELPPLPVFDSGGALVDIADREALYEAMDVLHDAHTAILMREHGIRRLVTRDGDFRRFPFLDVVDPLADLPAT